MHVKDGVEPVEWMNVRNGLVDDGGDENHSEALRKNSRWMDLIVSIFGGRLPNQ